MRKLWDEGKNKVEIKKCLKIGRQRITAYLRGEIK